MNKILEKGKKMMWLLIGLCALLSASCSFDNTFDSEGQDEVALQLRIAAREEGDLNSRAVASDASETEVGQDHEYMHNLLVLLVDKQNKVVKKFLPDLSGNEAAQQGNLKYWVSEGFALKPGNYTVYAFANVNSYFDKSWASLAGVAEGESLPETVDINTMVLEDPAGKLDLITYFIPMSARKEIVVNKATRNISIGMDRLVSKIRMSAEGVQGAKVQALSFGGYADKVPLLPGNPLPESTQFDGIKEIPIPEGGLEFPTSGSLKVKDFYVNASPKEHPFQIKVTTDEKSGVTYEAQTKRNELPRNSIYPLQLQLNAYGLDLTAQCWVSPIGSFPVPVNVSFEDNTYNIRIPEGCQFAFTLNGISDPSSSSSVTDLKGTWFIEESSMPGIAFEGSTEEDVTTIKGHVTAAAGQKFDLKMVATWKDGNASYKRTYKVHLTTAGIEEFPLSTYSSYQNIKEQSNGIYQEKFTLDYLKKEMLYMFIK